MLRTANRTLPSLGLAITMLVAACGGGGAAATPTAPAAATATATAAVTAAATLPPATAAVTASPAPAATSGATGPANLDAASEVQAGKQFDVTWTGPNAQGDYVTIVLAGATKWTTEQYFYTTSGSPSKLTAPSQDGAYALWYVSGADDAILARRAIRVTPFQGDLLGPATVMAGSQFDVAWNGPNGPGDYVTIVSSGAKKWTTESYFYTTVGSPGKLTADINPGNYELWYVIGADSKVKAKRPIVVAPYLVTLDAPDQVDKKAQIAVTWTGPNGPSDYITIVPLGSEPGTYLSYAYTSAGSPATITAPDQAGAYEIWYASDRVKNLVFQRIPIKVN